MSTRTIEVITPFDLCKKCERCEIGEITFDNSFLDDEEAHIEKQYYCKHNDICVNAVTLYFQNNRKEKE